MNKGETNMNSFEEPWDLNHDGEIDPYERGEEWSYYEEASSNSEPYPSHKSVNTKNGSTMPKVIAVLFLLLAVYALLFGLFFTAQQVRMLIQAGICDITLLTISLAMFIGGLLIIAREIRVHTKSGK